MMNSKADMDMIFSPELWETTTYEFLKTVRRLALT